MRLHCFETIFIRHTMVAKQWNKTRKICRPSAGILCGRPPGSTLQCASLTLAFWTESRHTGHHCPGENTHQTSTGCTSFYFRVMSRTGQTDRQTGKTRNVVAHQ